MTQRAKIRPRALVEEPLQIRLHAAARGPALVYLPGLHGDWTLVGAFRHAIAGRASFTEITYPRTTTWTLTDYSRAVDDALANQGTAECWLLAESFGSQVAWAWLSDNSRRTQIRGLILAGGFVRYGQPWLARAGERVLGRIRAQSLQYPLQAYARAVRLLRFRNAACREDLAEFVQRRTEADKLAAAHRLRLIADADWRLVAGGTPLPVFHLSGLVDPVVPWWPVHRWLRRHCPGFRGARVILASDHNVLGSAPGLAADQVLAWIASAGD